MGETVTKNDGINRAKLYQLVLFPLNNGATNVYYVLVLAYIATFGSNVLGLGVLFASVMVTGMRVFDAFTDPIIGALMDRTNGKFGKFRPFMVIGNLIMALSIITMYVITPGIPESMMGLRYAAFVGLYAIWVIGYTFQTSCTRAGQTVLTSDPNQRPLFTIFNTVGSLAGMGVMQFLAPIIRANVADYSKAEFYKVLTPIGITVSILLTILAIIGIWEKDQPKYFGIGGSKQEKVKISEYIEIIKNNSPMKRLMIAGAGCKLALSIATNTTVLCMLYGSMMGNYDGLYLPMMIVGYIFSVPFFVLTVRTSQKKGQRASLLRYVSLALICYVGVLVLLLAWKLDVPALNLVLISNGKFSINLYTVLFILFFGVGYGAYYSTADMPIPMVADCSDYETYRSGKYIPGIMGTLFSLVDKLVSSLSATVVGIAVSLIGIKSLPTAETPFAPGMNAVVIILFCIVPMIAWVITIIAMKGYILTGDEMKKIQDVNQKRKKAIAEGMSIEKAMKEFT
ncbi:MFS transporter [Butyrivibrio sp. YAB3001]|jgi:Na+/melibiose symporter-like transporter|uniref:MFS transporter n=1 Tax=Butyrivibrio sp. YAB3001 TaxID=1520812 RepID=UPI0008F67355|nr:MFS transporter [Butyrivibrio sp. YAB3001]SFC42526.1 Na+/melibiose symporter [Butyrivibrio sp. YAB3001]